MKLGRLEVLAFAAALGIAGGSPEETRAVVVDEHVESAERGERGLDRGLHLISVSDVTSDAFRGAAFLSDRGGDGLEVVTRRHQERSVVIISAVSGPR